jgi:thioredoxin-related protein
MRRLFFLLVICAAGICRTARSENVEWLTDVQAAQAKAKAEDKLVLLDFTGSDWCGWCKRLKKNVFDKPEFAEFARSKLVLVEVDFPHNKKLPQEQQETNARLDKTYGIESYPTIILLNADGKLVGRTGFVFGGASAFISRLEKLIKAKSPAAEPEKTAQAGGSKPLIKVN